MESDLRPGRTIDLSAIAGGANTARAADAPERRGVGVASWLLAGVLILLAAEWLLISRRKSRSESRGLRRNRAERSPQSSVLSPQSSKGRAS
ncbi:MAG: hypothetical protein LC793_16615 [Thermomicrobia bacterium]|nr:hypothetical protein [Thermomicrobia bacterium]